MQRRTQHAGPGGSHPVLRGRAAPAPSLVAGSPWGQTPCPGRGGRRSRARGDGRGTAAAGARCLLSSLGTCQEPLPCVYKSVRVGTKTRRKPSKQLPETPSGAHTSAAWPRGTGRDGSSASPGGPPGRGTRGRLSECTGTGRHGRACRERGQVCPDTRVGVRTAVPERRSAS